MLKHTISVVLLALTTTVSYAGEPAMTSESCWEYMVNNAIRTIDEYAMDNNPNAVFIPKPKWQLTKQVGGQYKGKYVLYLTKESQMGTSFAGLIPQFDIMGSCKNIDDARSDLWKVVVAKQNGVPF